MWKRIRYPLNYILEDCSKTTTEFICAFLCVYDWFLNLFICSSGSYFGRSPAGWSPSIHLALTYPYFCNYFFYDLGYCNTVYHHPRQQITTIMLLQPLNHQQAVRLHLFAKYLRIQILLPVVHVMTLVGHLPRRPKHQSGYCQHQGIHFRADLLGPQTRLSGLRQAWTTMLKCVAHRYDLQKQDLQKILKVRGSSTPSDLMPKYKIKQDWLQ